MSGIGFLIAGARAARRAPAAAETAAATMTPVASVKQIMRGIVSPAAKKVFEAVSTTVSFKGSYEKKNARQTASGTLTAPFSGIHGWYWENPGNAEVTVTLSAAGFYNMSHEFKKDAAPKTKMFQ